MTLVDVAPFAWPSLGQSFGATNVISNVGTLNATGEGLGFVFFVPASGIINRVGLLLASVTNADSSTQLTVALRTVDPATGDPTSTLYDAGNGQWQKTGVGIISDGWIWFDFTGGDGNGAATVTKGDLIAVVTEGTVIGGSDTLNLRSINENKSGQHNFPGGTADSGAGYSLSSVTACNLGFEYASTTFHPAPELYGFAGVETDTADEEKGIRFKAPFKGRISGFILNNLYLRSVNTSMQFHLMADATAPGGSRLASSPIIEDDVAGGGGQNYYKFGYARFGTSYEIIKNTWYRLVQDPTGGGARLVNYDVDTNGILKQFIGTTDCYWTEDDGGGGWADNTTKMVPLQLVFDQIDDGEGSGGGGGVIRRIPKILGGS